MSAQFLFNFWVLGFRGFFLVGRFDFSGSRVKVFRWFRGFSDEGEGKDKEEEESAKNRRLNR